MISRRSVVFFKCLGFILIFLFSNSVSSQAVFVKRNPLPEFLKGEVLWADSIINSMTLDEKIGQLFMVAAYSNKGKAHEESLAKLIEENHIGGLIFFKGSPTAQAEMCNSLQAKSTVPLMIAMDAEWGLAMRLDSTIKYPKQMTLGAIEDDSLIYRMGSTMAEELSRLGVHINFAPVVDINNNPNNPIIGYRSFGENKYRVANKGASYMAGLQDKNIFTTAKHFPGHGDTDADSHKTLPIINHDKQRLDTVELFPFRHMMARQLSGVMVAHLYIPELDSTENVASTLSPHIVKDLLRDEMGFEGLAFTDALNMEGVAKYWEPGEVDLKALLAGNDILLFPEDVPLAVEKIKQAITDSLITRQEINRICYRILKAKNWMGLNEYSPIEYESLTDHLNNDYSKRLREILYENAQTVLRNDSGMIPLAVDDKSKSAVLFIGGKGNYFANEIQKYGNHKVFKASSRPSDSDILELAEKLESYDRVIVGIGNLSNSPKKDFGLTDQAVRLIDMLNDKHKVVLNYFGNPYGLKKMYNARSLDGLVIYYEDNETTQRNAAKLMYGYSKGNGKLPVSVGALFYEGDGIEVNVGGMQNVMPEQVGLSSLWLTEIDSVIQEGLDAKAYPGCVVMMAKDGNIFFEKAFGYHTYDEKKSVKSDDVYDLASITKITATMAAVMKLQGDSLLDISKTLGDYLPIIHDTSEYKNLVIKDILTHQSGLMAWIPFYLKTLEKGEPNPKYYSSKKEGDFQIRVAENLYIHKNQCDTLIDRILSTDLRSKRDYKYSDLGYYFMKEIIESITNQKLGRLCLK